MAIQILPPQQTLGSMLGQSLGSGLGQGLQQLAQHKMQQVQQRNMQSQLAKGLQQINPNLSLEEASGLSQLGEGLLKPYIQQMLQAPQQEAYGSALQELLGGNQQHPQQFQQAQQQQIAKSAPKLTEKQATTLAKLGLQKQALGKKEEQEALKETKEFSTNVIKQEKAAKENDLRLKKMENLIGRGKLPNAGLWSFLSKIEEHGPISTGTVGGGIGAALGSIVPGLGTALGAGAGAVAGGVLGSLASPLAGAAKSYIRSQSPDVEEFEKLSNDFIKNAKQYFGSRLTDADLRAYMQTVPTLMQTDAGKKKIIENLKSLNDISKLEAKAMRDIIKEHGGKRPFDLEQQVQDKISDELDRLSEKFIVG